MPKYSVDTKLLYITNKICGSGGLERVLSIKASYLAVQLGYEVHIITLNQGYSPLFYEFSDKLIHHDINVTNKNPFSYIVGLKRKVKEICPDIISVCDDGIKGFFLPLILHKPCPMIYERHASKNIFKTNENPNFISKIKFSIFNILMNYGASTYDSFVVLTKDNLNEWKLHNLKVIPNPLSFYPDQRAKLINKKVITVGNHGFQKGYDRLLQSWKGVVEKHPGWKLEIYGKIDKEKKHFKLAEALKISDNVFFFEPVKNIYDKYNEASIYAMSSRSEGFGMVLIEAMAYGVPCIAFDCPCGPKDIITDSEDGFLVTNDDIHGFTEKLCILIENQELRLKMGSNARSKAKEYLPNIIVPQWDNLFNSLYKKK
jgi:glycosyltransferase involved in cell wall biosynthesis